MNSVVVIPSSTVTAQIVVDSTTTQVVVTPATTLELASPGIQGAPGADGDGVAYYGQVFATPGSISIATAGAFQSTGLNSTLNVENYGVVKGTTDQFAIKNNTGVVQLFKVYGSADIEAGNNKVLGIRLALNGVSIPETECQSATGNATSFAKLVTNWMIELQPNDEVALYVTNTTTAGPINLLRGRIVASTVGKQGATVVGTSGQVTYNDAGTSNGAELYYDKINRRLGIGTAAPAEKLDVAGKVKINIATLSSETTTLATTTATQIAAFPATFLGAKLIIQAADTITGERQISELLLIHDGTTVTVTSTGTALTNTTLATYSAEISNSNVIVKATSVSTNSTIYKVGEITL